uniref:Uncharacterized protein n=1 Tax=Arundo donax TaxID=35708 RepID=A0A0A9HNQ7_ARUDO
MRSEHQIPVKASNWSTKLKKFRMRAQIGDKKNHIIPSNWDDPQREGSGTWVCASCWVDSGSSLP